MVYSYNTTEDTHQMHKTTPMCDRINFAEMRLSEKTNKNPHKNKKPKRQQPHKVHAYNSIYLCVGTELL